MERALIVRRTLLLGAAPLLAACASARGWDTSLEDVIARNTLARGGARALDAVHTLRSHAEIVEPSFTVTGCYLASSRGLVRVDVYHQGRHVFSEGIDEAGPWSRQDVSRSAGPASAGGGAALRHGLEFNLFGLHAFAARGHQLFLEAREQLAGTNFHVVRVRLSDGFETRRYIDPITWQIVRSRDVRALHVDVDSATNQMESEFSDFREVQGVTSPFAWVERNLSTSAVVLRGATQQAAFNPDVAAEAYARAAPPQLPA